MSNGVHFILYVADQARSTGFYTRVLAKEPALNVPGMTEFSLGEGVVLGLMPESGIRRLLGPALPDPAGSRSPRAEVYLRVDSPTLWHDRALAAGAVELSAPAMRDWGHFVSYCLDPDGHVLAFASGAAPAEGPA